MHFSYEQDNLERDEKKMLDRDKSPPLKTGTKRISSAVNVLFTLFYQSRPPIRSLKRGQQSSFAPTSHHFSEMHTDIVFPQLFPSATKEASCSWQLSRNEIFDRVSFR